jgi:uncharacterized Zn finger protein
MERDESTIRDDCTDAVFERGQNYRDEGRIQQLDRFDDLVTATVSGSKLYDGTIEFGGRSFSTRGVPARTMDVGTVNTSSACYWISPRTRHRTRASASRQF